MEQSGCGPTERERVLVLRELVSGMGGWSAFESCWGYHGTGTSAADHAILTDAMGVELGNELREDFAAEFSPPYPFDEWRLRRGAVLRWVVGWYTEPGDRHPCRRRGRAAARIVSASGQL